MDFKSLRKTHKKYVDLIGTDPLSCLDVIETMENGDCMCVGLEVTRPESAIVDPTKLVINKVIPTFISADSFIDSSIFNIKGDQNSLGGFLKSQKGKLA